MQYPARKTVERLSVKQNKKDVIFKRKSQRDCRLPVQWRISRIQKDRELFGKKR